jgi:hypothetical protein
MIAQPIKTDLSLAISLLSPTLHLSATVHRPRAANPQVAGPVLPLQSAPTRPEKTPVLRKAEKKSTDEHNVQPLLDYLKEAMAEHAATG